MRREIYPEVIGIRSRRGGTGKTTYALKLAQEQTLRGKRVCVIDFDILGAGIMPVLEAAASASESVERIRRDFQSGRKKHLEHYYTISNPAAYDPTQLYVSYQGFTIIFNETSKQGAYHRFMVLVNHEHSYQAIAAKTDGLLKKLGADGFDLVIIDCHTGDYILAEVVAKVADSRHTVLAPDNIEIIKPYPQPHRRVDPR